MPDLAPLELKVWGDFACFTRPEMKVERVTYAVMTPSAARGVLEAVFWKPEFRWQVREIHVLREIAYFNILRNEVTSRASYRAAQSRLAGGSGFYAEDDRAQRNALILRDVAYLIRADIVLQTHTQDDVAKYRDQFRRRVQRGQSWQQPYLGCREFAAGFGPPENDTPIDRTGDLGRMLFDIAFRPEGNLPRFFPARLDRGVLRVPLDLYEEVA